MRVDPYRAYSTRQEEDGRWSIVLCKRTTKRCVVSVLLLCDMQEEAEKVARASAKLAGMRYISYQERESWKEVVYD